MGTSEPKHTVVLQVGIVDQVADTAEVLEDQRNGNSDEMQCEELDKIVSLVDKNL